MTRPMRILPVLPGNETAVASALAAALDGSGPPIAPVDGNLPDLTAEDPPGPAGTAEPGGPGGAAGPAGPAGTAEPAGPAGAADESVAGNDYPGATTAGEPDEIVLAVTTSGSTGAPRRVGIGRDTLVASAAATERRLGGPGQWLLALPVHHIAGLQVLSRSVLARTEPVVLDLTSSFTAESFAAATARLDGARRYTSLVPTQLHRALATREGRAALASYDAVLVGGAATSPALLRSAAEAGVRVVRTYGMTETAGGCVYDGRPLDGVRVRLDEAGRIFLAGPVLAARYLGEPDLTRETFVEVGGERWLRTDDLGEIDDDGVLRVLGRIDDVITTGGLKIAPAPIEAVLTELPAIAHACVVGVPDPEWGAVVVAVVVLAPGAEAPGLGAVRDHIAPTLGARAVPRRLLVVPEIPARGPGKPDRRAVARLAAAAGADGRGTPA